MSYRRTELTRKDYLERLQAAGAAGTTIIGAGAGTGISAKCAEAGGADLIIIYNSGSLPDGRSTDRWRVFSLSGRCQRHCR